MGFAYCLLIMKCIINWFLVLLGIRKPLLVIFTGTIGGGKTSAVKFANKLPGVVGLQECTDEVFSELFFNHVPQDKNSCRHILFSFVIPKVMIALTLVRRRFLRPHMVVLDRLALDNLGFSYTMNFKEPDENFNFCLSMANRLHESFNVKIYFIEYISASVHREVLSRRAESCVAPKEKLIREEEINNYDWFVMRELNFVLRHYYRAAGYSLNQMRYVAKSSDSPLRHQDTLMNILYNAL